MSKEEKDELDYWLARNVLRWEITRAELKQPIKCPIVTEGGLGQVIMDAWEPTRDLEQVKLVLAHIPRKFRLRLAVLICKAVKEVWEE